VIEDKLQTLCTSSAPETKVPETSFENSILSMKMVELEERLIAEYTEKWNQLHQSIHDSVKKIIDTNEKPMPDIGYNYISREEVLTIEKKLYELFSTRSEPLNDSKSIKDEIQSNIKDEIQSSIKDEIQSNIKDEIRSNIKDEIRSNIKDEIRSNIKDEIRSNIKDEIVSLKSEIKLDIKKDNKRRDDIVSGISDKILVFETKLQKCINDKKGKSDDTQKESEKRILDAEKKYTELEKKYTELEKKFNDIMTKWESIEKAKLDDF
jgi:hypothetical protein